MHSDELPVKQ